MATNERRALLRRLGFKLLEHAAVEVHTDARGNRYATLKSLPDDPIDLRDPEYLEQMYAGYPQGDYIDYIGGGRLIYADCRLRVDGMYYNESFNRVEMYRSTSTSGTEHWRVPLSGGARPRFVSDLLNAVNLSGLTRFKLRDLPPGGAARAGFITNFCRYLFDTRGGDKERALVNQLLAASQAMLGIRHGEYVTVDSYATWRDGKRFYESEFIAAKAHLRELGRLIGRPDADSAEFMDVANSLLETPAGLPPVALALWNDRHPVDDIIQCSCGHIAHLNDTHPARGGGRVCQECVDSGEYVMVEDLGLYGYRDDTYRHDDDCYYSYPDDDIDEDDGDRDVAGVRGYSTDVREYLMADDTIKSSSYGEFLMGIELEVVPKRDRRDAVNDTLEYLAQGYAILKNDGSLDDGGFEIVTAPRGLAEHIDRFSKWKPHPTLRAWDAGCCGMHVHMSSAAFTPATLGKFIEFINSEQNDDLIYSIAGRHPRSDGQAQDYCQRDGCQIGNPKKTLDGKSPSRYYMVNTTNVTREEAQRLGLNRDHANGRSQNTIEVRVFRASLKKARLLAQIEFAHAAVMFCRWSSMRELDQEHFLKWLKGMAGIYPNLAKWYGVRANTEVVEAAPKVRAGAEV